MIQRRIALVAGVPRSGSTWCFNALRLLLRQNSQDVYAAWCRDYDSENMASWHLIKAHKPEEVQFEPTHIVTSYRDICESIASLVRMGWVKAEPLSIIEAAKRQTALYRYWKDLSNFEVSYDDMLAQPENVIAELADTLGLPATGAGEIAAELSTMSPPDSGSYDTTTLLHPKHRGDPEEVTEMAAKVYKILSAADAGLLVK